MINEEDWGSLSENLDIEKLESQILQLCESSPEAARFQYMLECRLSHCNTQDERMQVYLDLMQEKLQELTEQYDKLSTEIQKFLRANDDLSGTS